MIRILAVVLTYDRAEWERILANVRPSPIYVSGGREWFIDGLSIRREWREKPER